MVAELLCLVVLMFGDLLFEGWCFRFVVRLGFWRFCFGWEFYVEVILGLGDLVLICFRPVQFLKLMIWVFFGEVFTCCFVVDWWFGDLSVVFVGLSWVLVNLGSVCELLSFGLGFGNLSFFVSVCWVLFCWFGWWKYVGVMKSNSVCLDSNWFFLG